MYKPKLLLFLFVRLKSRSGTGSFYDAGLDDQCLVVGLRIGWIPRRVVGFQPVQDMDRS